MKSNGDMLGALQSSMINTAPERGWGNCWIGNSIAMEMELEIKATFIKGGSLHVETEIPQ